MATASALIKASRSSEWAELCTFTLAARCFCICKRLGDFDTKLKLIDTLTEHLSFGDERCVRLSEQDSRALPVDSPFKDLAPPDQELGDVVLLRSK